MSPSATRLAFTCYSWGDGSRLGTCGVWLKNRSWFFECGLCGHFEYGFRRIDDAQTGSSRHKVHTHEFRNPKPPLGTVRT